MAGDGEATRQTKGRNRADREKKQPGLGSSRRPRPWMLALETNPDEVPDGAKDKKSAIRRQFQEQNTKGRVPASREEVKEITEKEQPTSLWKS